MLPLLNLNFKDAVVKSGARSEYINATIILQDNILMAKTSTKVLAIKYDLSKCRKVYSLPSNDKIFLSSIQIRSTESRARPGRAARMACKAAASGAPLP